MKLHIEHTFPCDADTVWDTFNDPAFEAKLEEASGVRYEELSQETVDGVEVRRLEVLAKKELPKVVAKALGADRLSYTQENRLDREEGKLYWTVTPMALSDKVTAEGVTMVREREGRSHRIVDGTIEVSIPLVGKRIEKMLVQEIESSYERAAEVAQEFIADRKAAS